MAWQLIYTSAPRGLVPGRSGFCTVARHREIRDGLVTAIERFSQYDRSGRAAGTSNPVVYAHRIVRLGGSSYHVLSCTRDAGADYTGRTNHLAHHLICEPHELAGAPSPAEVLRQMAWQRAWSDAPRYLGTEEVIDLGRFVSRIKLPAQEWQTVTRDAGCAALPLESGALAGSFWLYPPEAGEHYLLPLFAESLLLLDPAGRSPEKRWQVPFTTYLQSTDDAAEFVWRGCWHGSPAAAAAQGARQIFDLTQPLRAPASEAAALARTGETAAPPPAAPAAAAAEPTLPVEPVAPASHAEPTGGEIDLVELLASADDAKSQPGKWAKGKTSFAAEKSGTSRGTGPGRAPATLLVLAAAALVVAGGLAVGFAMWRESRAEKLCSEIRGARNSGDLAGAEAKGNAVSWPFRSYAPLQIEIERTKIAGELDRLKTQTPADADRYLTQNRARLAAKTMQIDPMLEDRRKKVERWRDAAARVSAMHGRIAGETFRERKAGGEIKKSFNEEERAIASLDAPYRPTVAAALDQAKRAYVRRRLEALEQSRQAGVPPAEIELIVVELLKDAERFAVAPELKFRIEELYRPPTIVAPVPQTEPPERPTASAPLVAQAVASDALPGVPTVPTFVALGSPAGFDLSALAARRGGFPSATKWQLFRSPTPPLDPPGEGESCELNDKGKFYDKNSALLFTLKSPLLSFSADRAKLDLVGNFLLRTVSSPDAADRVQIVFWQSAGSADALLPLPVTGHLVRRGNLVTIEPKVASALDAIKPASTHAALVLKRKTHSFAAASYADLKVDLSTEMEAANRQVQQASAALAGPAAELKMAQEIDAARLLLGKLLEDFGVRLFRGFTVTEEKKGDKPRQAPIVDAKHQLAGIQSYLRHSGGGKTFDSEKQLTDYLQQILWKLGNELPHRKKEVHSIHAEVSHELGFLTDPPQRAGKVISLWRTKVPALAAEEPPRKEKDSPTKLETFCATWQELFSDRQLPALQAFLRGSGADVAKVMKEAEARLGPLRAKAEQAQAALDRLEADLPDLGPFFLDLEFRGPNPAAPAPVVRLIEFSDRSAK